MKLGNFKIFCLLFLLIFSNNYHVFAEDEIQSVPLINLEELSPTFEEDKTELENLDEKNIILNKSSSISDGSKSIENDKENRGCIEFGKPHMGGFIPKSGISFRPILIAGIFVGTSIFTNT